MLCKLSYNITLKVLNSKAPDLKFQAFSFSVKSGVTKKTVSISE